MKSALEGRGQTILTGANTAEIYGDGKVEGVRLKDGREIPASLVVMAVGIRPSTALAREAGLEVNRGIKVDDHRSEEHTSELQSLMRISYAVFCLKKKKKNTEQ